MAHPRKRFYRARAHSNPLNDQSFDVPTKPEEFDWWVNAEVQKVKAKGYSYRQGGRGGGRGEEKGGTGGGNTRIEPAVGVDDMGVRGRL